MSKPQITEQSNWLTGALELRRQTAGKRTKRSYGETYAQALEESDYEYETLKQAAWVAREFEMCDRSHILSWTHHLRIAGAPKEQRQQLIHEAERDGLTVGDVLRFACDDAGRLVYREREIVPVKYRDPLRPWAGVVPAA